MSGMFFSEQKNPPTYVLFFFFLLEIYERGSEQQKYQALVEYL